MTDFKTALGKIRGLGSAKNGTHHWLQQRLTALGNIPLMIFLLVSFAGQVDNGYQAWRDWIAQPFVAVVLLLFMGNIFYHMRLGLQVLIEDYLHGSEKLFCLILLNFTVIFFAALSFFSILRIAFGG